MAGSRGRWLRRALVALGLVLAVPLGLFLYSLQFDPQEDFPGQRAQLAKRTPVRQASKLDAAMLLEDVRRLAAPEMEGREVGTPGGRKARQYLVQRFRDTGLEPLGASFEQPFEFQPSRGASFWKTSPPPVSAANVIGSIRGSSEPEQVLLVTAHYDHEGIKDGVLYPGADDNASGVATMLAVARHFRAHPPRRTLVFVAFDAEETGLEGAVAFLAKPPVPTDSMQAMVNFDMVSRNPDNEIVVVGLHSNPQLRPLLERVRDGAAAKLLFGHDQPRPFWNGRDDWTMLSDQGVFHEAGIPFLYFGVEDHADYHQPTDTFERLDKEFFIAVADAAIDVVAALDAAPAAQLSRHP